jgi:hypothetical protein
VPAKGGDWRHKSPTRTQHMVSCILYNCKPQVRPRPLEQAAPLCPVYAYVYADAALAICHLRDARPNARHGTGRAKHRVRTGCATRRRTGFTHRLHSQASLGRPRRNLLHVRGLWLWRLRLKVCGTQRRRSLLHVLPGVRG